MENQAVSTGRGITVLALIAVGTSSLSAQDTRREENNIRAEYAAATAAGGALLAFLDEPVQRFVQDHRSSLSDEIAHAFRQLGEVDIVLPGTLGILAVGTATNDLELERSGGQLFVSIGIASAITVAGKLILGRERPGHPDSSKAWSFDPFSGVFGKAFPSGHSAVAFAVATTLADLSDSRALRGLLYAAAGGTAWSRLNDNRHWLTDVVFGTIVGITASKITTGRWRVFGVETPDYLATEREEPVGAGELALSAAVGIGILKVAQLTGSSELNLAPEITRLDNGTWALGLSLPF